LLPTWAPPRRARDDDAVRIELGVAADEATEALARRNRLVAAAVRGGLSRRAVARATGMTHSGITKIVVRLAGAERAKL
jgi:hypothetical protein